MQTRVLMLAISAAVMTWAASAVAAPSNPPGAAGSQGNCSSPNGIVREDYFVEFTSNLPQSYGLPARLQVHRVFPNYLPAVVQTAGQAAEHNPAAQALVRAFKCPVVVLQHGSGFDSVAAFDLQFQDYSLMEALAWAGIDAFAVNLLGWGLSDRFIIDDPCSAGPTQQKNFLIPNPLSGPPWNLPPDKTQTCGPDWPFHFTTTYAMRDQLNAVIDDVLKRTGVSQVTLHGWSLGGAIVADYVLNGHPEKVKNVIFQAPALTCATQVPNPIQCWVAPRIRFPSQGFQSGQCMTG